MVQTARRAALIGPTSGPVQALPLGPKSAGVDRSRKNTRTSRLCSKVLGGRAKRSRAWFARRIRTRTVRSGRKWSCDCEVPFLPTIARGTKSCSDAPNSPGLLQYRQVGRAAGKVHLPEADGRFEVWG